MVITSVHPSFEDASNVTSGSIASRTWKWGDGNVTSGNDDKPFHKYTNPGAYKVTLVINSAAGCTDSIQKTVTTYPKPKADFRFTTHCADSAIEFYDLSTMPGGSVYAWKWLFGDGKYSFDQNPTHVYGGEFGGVYPVQLTAYSKLTAESLQTFLNVKSAFGMGETSICFIRLSRHPFVVIATRLTLYSPVVA